MRTAVIGAGVVGVSVARELAMDGADVTVLEAHRPGGGTSGTTFAWVNSHDKHPDSYHALNVAGCEEHTKLAGRGRSTPSYFRTGNLVWADDPDGDERLRRRFDRLRGLGYRSQWLDPVETRRLEPRVRLPAGLETVGYFPDEGYALPESLVAELLGEAREHGAVLRCPAEVQAIRPGPSGVDLVVDGEVERFDRVVSCAGRATERLLATAGADVRLAATTGPERPTVGLLARVRTPGSQLSRVLTTPRVNVRPDGDGRLLLQSLELDATIDPDDPPEVDGPIAEALLDRLRAVLAVSGASVETLRLGHRVLPADGLPIAGFVDPDRRCYVLATHSGVTLGPLLGRLVTREIRHDEALAILADYRPDRFAGTDRSVTVSAPRRPGEQ